MKRNTIALTVSGMLVLGWSCGSEVSQDPADASPPTLKIRVVGTKASPTGVDVVSSGSTVQLDRVEVSQVYMDAEDPQGVSRVELWVSEGYTCPGTSAGPGLAGKPADTWVADLSDGKAPTIGTAYYELPKRRRAAGCRSIYEVRGFGFNTATPPLKTPDPATATLVVDW